MESWFPNGIPQEIAFVPEGEHPRCRYRPTSMKMVWAVLVLALLAGCTPTSPHAIPGAESSPTVEIASTPEPAEWTAPASYSFELKSSCGERNLIGRFHVVVTDGETRARALDERARAFMRYEDDFGGVPSIEELLMEVAEARKQDAHVAEVAFDQRDENPARIDIDYNEEAIDDEACYVINDYEQLTRCNDVLCISDTTMTTGQEVTITFAPPEQQIWGVEAQLRPLGKERIGWLYGYSDDEQLRTVWPRPNVGFEDIGFYGRAEWIWTVPDRLEPGVYEITKESIRQGSAPIEERIETWTISFEVTRSDS